MAREISQNPFWMSIKNNFPSGSSIEEFLKKPGVTVEDLLEADFMVSDYVRSQEVIYFLSKKKNLKRLLEYIIEEPPMDANHKRGHKFPFMVHEILNTDHSPILDWFFNEDEHDVDDNREDEVDEDEDDDENKDHSSTDDNDSIQNDINLLNKLDEQESNNNQEEGDSNNAQDADQKDSVNAPLTLDRADSLEQYLADMPSKDDMDSAKTETSNDKPKGKYLLVICAVFR